MQIYKWFKYVTRQIHCINVFVCVCVCVCVCVFVCVHTFPVSSGPGCKVTEQGRFWGIYQNKHMSTNISNSIGHDTHSLHTVITPCQNWVLSHHTNYERHSRSSFPLAVRTWPQWWMGKCTGQNISSKGSACAAAMYSFEAVITSCIIIHYLSKLIFCFNNSNWGFELNTTRLECLLHLGSRNSAPLTGLFFIIDSKLFEFFLVLTLRETLKELKRHLDGCVNQENQNLSFCY